jgi:hypothetical protein
MWDGHEGHQVHHHEQKHMQIASGQKQQDGHLHGENGNEMYNSVHFLGGGPYMHHEVEVQGDGQKHANLDSVQKVVHWNHRGHGHSIESGGKLGATHGEVFSGSQNGHGHMTHSTDHIGINGDVPTQIFSGHHKGGVENYYTHLEYSQGQVPCADYGGAVGGDHSEMNAGHYHVSSEDCKGNIRGGHTQVGHGFGQVLSGNYGGELGGHHSHKDYELGHVLSADYEKVAGGGQSHMDTVNDHVLIGDYGGKTGSIQSHGYALVSSGDYGGNLGGVPNHIGHADAYHTTGGFEGETMMAQGHMGYGHKSNGYKVHENIRENQPSGHQNYGINDNMPTNLRYVEYIDTKTATDLVDQSVGLNGSHELDPTKHQHLHIDGSVIRNSYGGAARGIWYNSHNSVESDQASFEHSFGNNHVD